MFTGIIEAIAEIKGIRPAGGKSVITFARPAAFTDLKPGSSVCCNGICLTVISLGQAQFTVEIMHETLQKTTAAVWQTGHRINLERALALGSRLDGHWVQGHVDTVAALLETRKAASTLYLTFDLAAEDRDLVVPQGSVAVNGVSLTVAKLETNRFSVALIGHTLGNTNLAELSLGGRVNLEYDILGKYVRRSRQRTSITEEFLHEQGF